jgi:hypothetical protein
MEDAGRRSGGLLKVVVAHGRNLAVRDFTSSDPYVIVRVADMVSSPGTLSLQHLGHFL